MKSGKGRVVIIYFLVLILIVLIIGLIFFIKQVYSKDEDSSSNEIRKECVFNMNLEQYNDLQNDSSLSSLCSGYNRININDIRLDGKKAGLYSVYYNGISPEGGMETGVYFNNNITLVGASYNDQNVIRVINNLLFIQKKSSVSNVVVYNGDGENVYDLSGVLGVDRVSDPVFVSLAEVDPSMDVYVDISDIDSGSFSFDDTGFSFSTTSKCGPNQVYRGSIYKVGFEGANLGRPEFVSKVSCDAVAR